MNMKLLPLLPILTISIQHLGDIKVLLSDIKGQVEVVHIIALSGSSGDNGRGGGGR